VSSWKTISRASLLAALLGGTALAQDPIEVERLDALDPLEVGLPGASMGQRMWDGTGRDMAQAVLARLPAADGDGYASEALAEAARSVLASGGRPPAGGRGDAALAALRVDRLLAASGASEAFDLLERTPGINRAPALARWHAELGFATGNADRACRTANALTDNRDAPYWLRARAYCLALEGRDAAAELTAELARSAEPDDGFDARLFALTLDTPLGADAAGADSGLEWSMSRRLPGAGDGPGLAEDAPAWLLAAAHDGAERRRPASVDDPMALFVTAEEALEGMERHHALEAVLAQGRDRELAGQALGVLLADTGGGDRFIHVARHHGREIETLPITRATLEHGYEIALAALLVGDVGLAREWRDRLMNGPPRQTPPPGLTVAGPDGLAKPLPMDEAAALVLPPEPEWVPPSPRRMVALDLAIAVAADEMRGGPYEAVQAAWLEGQGEAVLPDMLAMTRLGAPMPAGLRERLLADETPATAGGLAALDAAVRAGVRGEAALLAVGVLADPAASGNPDAFSRAIAALDAVGLRDAALSILLERAVKRAL
jgi:hypothetical protein